MSGGGGEGGVEKNTRNIHICKKLVYNKLSNNCFNIIDFTRRINCFFNWKIYDITDILGDETRLLYKLLKGYYNWASIGYLFKIEIENIFFTWYVS